MPFSPISWHKMGLEKDKYLHCLVQNINKAYWYSAEFTLTQNYEFYNQTVYYTNSNLESPNSKTWEKSNIFYKTKIITLSFLECTKNEKSAGVNCCLIFIISGTHYRLFKHIRAHAVMSVPHKSNYNQFLFTATSPIAQSKIF